MEIQLLRRCPLLAGLKEEDIKKIRTIGTPKKVAKKEVIFSDGEEAKGFYIILSGKVKLYKISPEGKEQILHIISAPEAFAEAALFLEGSYPAFAEALEESHLFFIPGREFVQLIEKNPRLGINMIVSLSQFLKKFTALIEELSLKEVSSRVAKYLLDLSLRAEREGKSPVEIELDVSKGQLASKLGTISETLSRTFKKLVTKGVIEVRKRRVKILDRRSLEELASGLKI